MNEDLNKFISQMNKKPGRSMLELQKAELELGIKFPELYTRFLLQSNGAIGAIGESYLELWSLEDIKTFNSAYKVDEYAPHLILFGSDGGDMAYAFDRRFTPMPIVETPFIGMGLEKVKTCGQTFLEFLEYMYKQH